MSLPPRSALTSGVGCSHALPEISFLYFHCVFLSLVGFISVRLASSSRASSGLFKYFRQGAGDTQAAGLIVQKLPGSPMHRWNYVKPPGEKYIIEKVEL